MSQIKILKLRKLPTQIWTIVSTKSLKTVVSPSLNASKAKMTLRTTTKLEKPSLKLFRTLMKIRSRHIKKLKEPMPFKLSQQELNTQSLPKACTCLRNPPSRPFLFWSHNLAKYIQQVVRHTCYWVKTFLKSASMPSRTQSLRRQLPFCKESR